MKKQKKPDSVTILSEYATGPSRLEAALSGLKEADLDCSRAPGEWTIRQIVHHVADGDDLWKIPIKAALGNPQSVMTLEWYQELPQTEWVQAWRHADRKIGNSMDLIRANRQQVMEILQGTPGALQKTFWFKRPKKRRVKVTIGDVLELMAHHVAEHIEEIQQVRQQHGI